MANQSFYPSVSGRQAGFVNDSTRKRFVSDGGLASGVAGMEIRLPSPHTAALFDDFTGDVLADQWDYQEGTDTATAAGVTLAGGVGGILRLTTGDAGTGLAADMCQVTAALQWKAANGNLCFQARAKLSAITTCYVFMGFTDLAASLEAPIESAASANTLTTNATDAVGFMFDTRMSADNWWATGVANNVDATAINTALAPVADTWATYRVELSTAGVATFFIDGTAVGRMTGAVTASVALTPTINVSKTSVAASMTMDVDYVHVSMSR